MRFFTAGLIVVGALNMALAQNILEQNRLLGRGINFGNALEAPSEGAWGLRLEERYFDLVKQAGFNHIRLPVSWTHHAAGSPPHAIRPEFLARVDWAIAQATQRGLRVVLNLHHHDPLNANPALEEARYLAIWRQLAERYKSQPATVLFELLNEPHGKFNDDPALWNALLPKALATVRQTNPTRAVIVGPVWWNNVTHLDRLTLPADPNLIVTVHFYDPFEFTHQGAEWVNPAPPVGRRFPSADDQARMRQTLDKAQQWGQQNNRPIYVGEFGSYSKADPASRVAWTGFVRSELEKRGFSWAYWEFGAGFGAYDRLMDEWRKPLLEALIPPR